MITCGNCEHLFIFHGTSGGALETCTCDVRCIAMATSKVDKMEGCDRWEHITEETLAFRNETEGRCPIK